MSGYLLKSCSWNTRFTTFSINKILHFFPFYAPRIYLYILYFTYFFTVSLLLKNDVKLIITYEFNT